MPRIMINDMYWSCNFELCKLDGCYGNNTANHHYQPTLEMQQCVQYYLVNMIDPYLCHLQLGVCADIY